jgi:hypothetical protein
MCPLSIWMNFKHKKYIYILKYIITIRNKEMKFGFIFDWDNKLVSNWNRFKFHQMFLTYLQHKLHSKDITYMSYVCSQGTIFPFLKLDVCCIFSFFSLRLWWYFGIAYSVGVHILNLQISDNPTKSIMFQNQVHANLSLRPSLIGQYI